MEPMDVVGKSKEDVSLPKGEICLGRIRLSPRFINIVDVVLDWKILIFRFFFLMMLDLFQFCDLLFIFFGNEGNWWSFSIDIVM